MQDPRGWTCAFSFLTDRLPIAFQRSPYRLPVGCRRFHHHFLDLVLRQPLRQPAELLRVRRKTTPLKLVLAVHFDIDYYYRQLLLMDVDSRYAIHTFLLAGAESVPQLT